MLLFKEYMLVGGLPQSVSAFIDGKKDLNAADDVKREILNLYRDDIRKVPASYKSYISKIFDQIPGLLSKHEKRVVFSELKSKSQADSYEESFFWLSDYMICNVCFRSSNPEIGLNINEDKAYVKCYMGDTGLLVCHAFSKKEIVNNDIYNLILNNKLSINEGMLYENAVSQMLDAAGYPLYFYTRYNADKHRNDIEIDFLISESGSYSRMISPVEVKSTKRYSTTSLYSFKEIYKRRITRCIVIHPGNLKTEGGILYIQPYMTYCL